MWRTKTTSPTCQTAAPVEKKREKRLTTPGALTKMRASSCGGVERSLVAHLVWDQGVGGSNPSTPTSNPKRARSSTG